MGRSKLNNSFDCKRRTTQFYEDMARGLKKKDKSISPEIALYESVRSPLDELPSMGGEVEEMGRPKGSKNKPRLIKFRAKSGRRKRDYVDVALSDREFGLLKAGKKVVKPLQGSKSGVWVSISLAGNRVNKQIKKLKAKIRALQGQR